jgi:hypothetical protein
MAMPDGLYRVTMRLARNPAAHAAEGDDHRGYTMIAPLTSDGHLDETLWRAQKEHCTVRAFDADKPARDGRLARRGNNWYFDYDRTQTNDDEPVFKLDRHKFIVGEYVTVTDKKDTPLTYRITNVDLAS